ncbi:hypothetical protein [Methanogenium sp. MK-MG]|uniref:hypothetical protein n=1 Tax=Methanogenium sp. MK-MG TaxID=2599926 RepID=UPI0013E9A8B4|nr:hypothetical protein [Methanogenium sp. MK-MG]KAF1078864.1 hypothetical protein MKMG_00283 [Methanogenium sp. MK-MG]
MNTDTVFAVHPEILRFERKIRHLTDAEMTGIFSEEGVSILTLHAVDTGNGFFTVIPEEIKERITDCILTHNHPSDRSFTKRDLKEASFFSLKEIRVVGRTGLYSMKPGAGGWPAPQVIADCFTSIEADPDFQAEIDDLSSSSERFTDAEDIQSGIARIWSDLLCERLAGALNLIYQSADWRDDGGPALQV